MESWIRTVEPSELRPLLSSLFQKYVDTTLEHCRRNFKASVQLPAISQVQTLCKILQGFLPKVKSTSSHDFVDTLFLVSARKQLHVSPKLRNRSRDALQECA